MAIRPRGTAAAPATPAPATTPPARTRTAPPAADPAPAEQPVAATPAPATGGIVTPRMRAAQARTQTSTTAVAAATVNQPNDDIESWGHTGDEAEAMANAQVVQREQAREERRARGYWPRKFELIEPSARFPDRYQADVIVLDARMSPSFWLHVLANPRTGRYDVNEPCPKEWDNCPLCPPAGKYDSRFVFLLTVLNINGFTRTSGPNAGEFVPVTQEIMVVETDNHAFFHNLLREKGTLRGLQLTMTRPDRNSPRIGNPSIPNNGTEHVIHDEAAIEAFLRDNGMWKQKQTKDGEIIDENPGWMMQPVRYADFLHRPNANDLRARYQGGGGAPVGSRQGGTEGGEWGGSRYEQRAATPPAGAGADWGGQVANAADLDDDVPF